MYVCFVSCCDLCNRKQKSAPGFVASSWGSEMSLPLRWLVRGAQLFAKSTDKCGEAMVKTLVETQKGAVLSDENGNQIKPMPEMTEERRKAVFNHCMETVQQAMNKQ